MTDFDNKNRGQLWKNSKKETEKHPDFTGSLNVEGKEYWVSGWKRKEGSNEKAPALSFSIKLKEDKKQSIPEKKESTTFDSFDDISEIPF